MVIMKDFKLNTWYISDNVWNKLWIYKFDTNKWFIYDPDSSGTLSVTDNLEEDNNIEIEKNQSLINYRVIKDIFMQQIDVIYYK
jgi:hypothetical protein